MFTGYLAGAIEGITIEEALSWRSYVKRKLIGYVNFLSPMEGKEKLVKPDMVINQENYIPSIFTQPDAIVRRDLLMINKSDFVLAFFTKNKTFFTGTLIEIGYAIAKQKMVIVVTDRQTLINHPFIKILTITFLSLEEAIEFLKNIENFI